MEGLATFATAFGLVGLLELGDKTQLATISLAARHPWRPVFAGASLGLVAVTAIGAAAGTGLSGALAGHLTGVRIAGGLVFIALGSWALVRKDRGDEERSKAAPMNPFITALSLNFLAELGDKTQIAVIVLAASQAAPLSVFSGAAAGLVTVTAFSVFIGVEFARRIREDRVRLVSAALLIGAGGLLIAQVLLGM